MGLELMTLGSGPEMNQELDASPTEPPILTISLVPSTGKAGRVRAVQGWGAV